MGPARRATNRGMVVLRDIASVISGVSVPGGGRGSVQYVQIKDLRPDGVPTARGSKPSAKRAVPIETSDLLISSRGADVAVVRASQAMVGAYASLDVYLLKPALELVDSRYLHIVLNGREALKHLILGSTSGPLPRLPKHVLEQVVVPLPPRPLQERIATIGALSQRCVDLQKRKVEAEAQMNAAILDRLIKSAT